VSCRKKKSAAEALSKLSFFAAMQSDNDAAVGSENKNENTEDDAIATAFKLAPFNPSSDQIQQKALGMLNLTSDDVLFDLGCGDGRFLCFAANQTPGLKCVGIEILAEYVSRGRDRVKESHLEDRIDIRLEDATKADIVAVANQGVIEHEQENEEPKTATSKSTTTTPIVQTLTLMEHATALYLFILPKGIVKMMPILESIKQKRLAQGKRFKVLSYMFKIHDWEATIIDKTAKGSCPVYYYDFGAP
jgi:precorrin-6B methylase 2